MNKIMNRPLDYEQYGYGLEDCHINIMKGEFIISDFYNKGIFHEENNIPKELEDKKWKPDPNKTYIYWWYSTNPSDPSDPGKDILKYIEEWNIYMDKPKLRSEIIEILYKLDSNNLLRVKQYLSKL